MNPVNVNDWVPVVVKQVPLQNLLWLPATLLLCMAGILLMVAYSNVRHPDKKTSVGMTVCKQVPLVVAAVAVAFGSFALMQEGMKTAPYETPNLVQAIGSKTAVRSLHCPAMPGVADAKQANAYARAYSSFSVTDDVAQPALFPNDAPFVRYACTWENTDGEETDGSVLLTLKAGQPQTATLLGKDGDLYCPTDEGAVNYCPPFDGNENDRSR